MTELARASGLLGRPRVIVLTVLVLLVAISNRVCFKISGYAIGNKPFAMIFLTVGSCIPINAIGYCYMLARTGGVLPECRTWAYYRDYGVIATFNVANGLGSMWSNPFVPGYMQCLLCSLTIPMTMFLSVIVFRSWFSYVAIGGVMLILAGTMYAVPSSSDAPAQAFSFLWTGVFAFAQLPLASASVYQEFAFKKSVNMLHYIHYVTLFSMLELLFCIPLDMTSVGDSSSFAGFCNNLIEATECLRGLGPSSCEGAGAAFSLYVVALNAQTLLQALLIKEASAAYFMIVLSLATPLTVMTYTCPLLVGYEYTEALAPSALTSTVMICAGTMVYRLGTLAPVKKAEGEQAEPLLG